MKEKFQTKDSLQQHTKVHNSIIKANMFRNNHSK